MEENIWSFSKRERIGIFGITLLTILCLIINHFFQPSPTLSANTIQAFEAAVKESVKNEAAAIAAKKEKYASKYPPKKSYSRSKNTFKNKRQEKSEEPKPIVVLKNFNPNLADKKTLTELGIPERTANTIINFRSKGGKFFKADDLKIIYGLSPTLFETLLPYITIPAVERKPKVVQVKTIKKLDLNLCTKEEIMELRGIGPTLSKRIISYREALGGFYTIDQLKEVYQLPDSTFESIKSYLSFTPIIKKVNINELEIPKLVKHPYLSQAVAGSIISLKDHEGKFKNWESIEKNIKITPKALENIQQYFDIY